MLVDLMNNGYRWLMNHCYLNKIEASGHNKLVGIEKVCLDNENYQLLAEHYFGNPAMSFLFVINLVAATLHVTFVELSIGSMRGFKAAQKQLLSFQHVVKVAPLRWTNSKIHRNLYIPF